MGDAIGPRSREMSIGPRSKEMFSAVVCQLLRESRHRQGLTQAQVAARTGGLVTKAALANYETGHRSLRIDVLWVIATALGEDLGELTSRASRAIGVGLASDGPLTVRFADLEAITDSRLEPVRRWMRLQGGGRTSGVITLDAMAIAALADIIGVTPRVCRAMLSPAAMARPPCPAA